MRILNILAVPGDVFEEIKDTAPTLTNWLVPALVLILVSWAGAWLMLAQPSVQQQLSELTEQAIQKQIERGKMPKDAADQAQRIAQIIAKASPYIAPVFQALITPFGWGFVLWLIGTQALKRHLPFLKAVEIAGLANTIAILETIVRVLLIVSFGSLFASPSLALLVKDFDPEKASHGLLATCNVMTIWVLAVRSIGLARFTTVPFARAGTWVFAVWAAFTGGLFGVRLVAKAAFGQ